MKKMLKRNSEGAVPLTDFLSKPKDAKLDSSLTQMQDVDMESELQSPLLSENVIYSIDKTRPGA